MILDILLLGFVFIALLIVHDMEKLLKEGAET